MSYLNTKQAFLTYLLSNLPTGLTVDDVAFENKDFDPSNKELWVAAYFIPVSSEAMSQSDSGSDEQRGIFQVSVFVPLNSDAYDNKQLEAIDEITTAFRYNTKLVYNTQTVELLDTAINAGSESEAWYQRDISINYLTFSER